MAYWATLERADPGGAYYFSDGETRTHDDSRKEISAEARLEQLDLERARLSRHLAELNAQLASLRKLEGPTPPSAGVHSDARWMAPSTSVEKVPLFREFFRGRANVFPKRWENASKGTGGSELILSFYGELTPTQKEVLQTMIQHDLGVFVALPGSGKTVVGADLIALRKRNTLVLVHRTQLLEQWKSQLAIYLDLKPNQVGQIGGGRRNPNGGLDVATFQSLDRGDGVDDSIATHGQVIVDECHHVPSVSFEQVMREVKARYVVGLTATPRRRDGHHPILQFELGAVCYAINAKNQAAARPFDHKLVIRETAFRLSVDQTDVGIQEIYRQLVADEKRNRLIHDDVIQALEEGRSPILLTKRRDHLEYFAERLRAHTANLIILRGGMKVRDRRAAIEQLSTIPETEERLLLATGQFTGEGFDDARLDAQFLAMPVSWRGTLVQYAGRLHRAHKAKTDVRMIAYVDRNVPMLANMFEKRMKGYRAMGYSIGDHPATDHKKRSASEPRQIGLI